MRCPLEGKKIHIWQGSIVGGYLYLQSRLDDIVRFRHKDFKFGLDT